MAAVRSCVLISEHGGGGGGGLYLYLQCITG